MKFFVVFGLTLGSLMVMQPSINRLVLEQRGLGFAVWFNAFVYLSAATITGAFLLMRPEYFPEVVRLKSNGGFAWWFFIPGLMGLCLVCGTTLLIKHVGAISAVLLMLCGQLFTSFAWDTIISQQSINSTRVIGLLLAGVGAYMSFK